MGWRLCQPLEFRVPITKSVVSKWGPELGAIHLSDLRSPINTPFGARTRIHVRSYDVASVTLLEDVLLVCVFLLIRSSVIGGIKYQSIIGLDIRLLDIHVTFPKTRLVERP